MMMEEERVSTAKNDECASHGDGVNDMSWCDVHNSRWRWDEDDCEVKIEREDPRT
jgi:hypothetical protein